MLRMLTSSTTVWYRANEWGTLIQEKQRADMEKFLKIRPTMLGTRDSERMKLCRCR